MQLLIDMVLHYRGYFGCASRCNVRIYEPTKAYEGYVAMYTELDDNPGTSVTNAAETVATSIWQYLERPEKEIVFIEHYHDRAFIGGRPQFKEHFDRVRFEPVSGSFARPRWRRICKEEVEQYTLGTNA